MRSPRKVYIIFQEEHDTINGFLVAAMYQTTIPTLRRWVKPFMLELLEKDEFDLEHLNFTKEQFLLLLRHKGIPPNAELKPIGTWPA